MSEESHISYEEIIATIKQWPSSMLAGLFAEVTQLCLLAECFAEPDGMERVVARLHVKVNAVKAAGLEVQLNQLAEDQQRVHPKHYDSDPH